MKVSQKARSQAGFDLSPMLDVIFQLILFFLVSTTFANLPGISVNLPVSETAQGADITGVIITVENDGTIYFNDESSSIDMLNEQMASIDTMSRAKDEFPITISADEEVTNGTLVKIFDAIRMNGFSAVSLRTNLK